MSFYSKRTMTNISFNITNLQGSYLGISVSMNKFMTDTQMAAVLTYLCTMCFLLRASVTDPPMYIVASAVLCRSLAIVRSLPLPGCGYRFFKKNAVNI